MGEQLKNDGFNERYFNMTAEEFKTENLSPEEMAKIDQELGRIALGLVQSMNDEEIKKMRTKRVEVLKGETKDFTVGDYYLFEMDKGFEDSDEFANFSKWVDEQKGDKQSEKDLALVHENVDFDRVLEVCNEKIEEMNADDLMDIVDSYGYYYGIRYGQDGEEIEDVEGEEPFREGNQKIVDYLSKILGLPKLPKILYDYSSIWQGVAGKYNNKSNSITINLCSGSDLSGMPGLIAHEMWHAFQYKEIQRKTERSRLYSLNFSSYVPSEVDEEGYRNQLVEAEAFYFGDTFNQIIHNIVYEKQ